MIKKCFISQKMKDKTENEILQDRAELKKVASDIIHGDVEFIESYFKEDPPDDVNARIWYLGKSIEQLSKADVLIVKGIDLFSKGCKIEYDVAELYEIKTIVI